MTRQVWLDWSRKVDFVGNLTTGPTGGPKTTFQVKETALLRRFRSYFGIYMFLENTDSEAGRRHAIEAWRISQDLDAGGGAEKLVYIGIVKSDRRDFVQRMREHHKKWVYQYTAKGQLFVKFSVCEYDVPDRDLPQLIEDAESVLVHEMQPYENTAKIGSYRIAEDIVVRNRGFHAPLPKVLRSSRHF